MTSFGTWLSVSSASQGVSVRERRRSLLSTYPNRRYRSTVALWWSGPLDAWEDWDITSAGGASFTQVAAKPDRLAAVRDNCNEVFGWGPETLQVFTPAQLALDPNDPTNLLDFAPTRTKAVGTMSPHSIIAVDDMFAFFDSKRRFVITAGNFEGWRRQALVLFRSSLDFE